MFKSKDPEKQAKKIEADVQSASGGIREGLVNAFAQGHHADEFDKYVDTDIYKHLRKVKTETLVPVLAEATTRLLAYSGHEQYVVDSAASLALTRDRQRRAAEGDPTIPSYVKPHGLYLVIKNIHTNPPEPSYGPGSEHGEGWLPPKPPASR